MEPDVTEPFSLSDGGNGDSQPGIPPVSIPDHKLLKRIGRGSYGEVWMARSSMGALRAIKIVYRKSFRDERPFHRELSGIRKFEPISRSHEGFIDVLHAGINDEEGYFYYIMELGDDVLRGQDIDPVSYSPRTLARELAPAGKLPIEQCLKLGLTLSQALTELHRHDLVHRDIKPSNIIFVHGVPKLADIGLVADVKEARSYVGTEGFIPPEGPGSPQADIYGLGKVLYEACTGKDRNDFPELPTNWDRGPEYNLFLELNEVLLEACKTDLRRRYQSAADMHADLVLLSNGKSLKRLKLLERRLAKLKGIAIASSISALVVAAFVYNFWREWRTRFEARQRIVGANVVNGTVAEESANGFAALPYFAQALALDKGNSDREPLHRLRFASVLEQCPKLERMVFAPTAIDKLCLCPDGAHLFASQFDGPARQLDLHANSSGGRLFGDHNVYDVALTADGTQAITGERNQVCVWRLSDGECVKQFVHNGSVYGVACSPDGEFILTACSDTVARIWKVHSTLVPETLAGHTKGVIHGAFSREGNLVGTGGKDGAAIIWNLRAPDKIKARFNHGTNQWVNHVAFSPDMKWFATACTDHKARVFDVETRQEILPELAHGDGVNCVEFSPDGRFILTASSDYTARIWLSKTHELLAPAGILPHTGRVMDAHFFPDGHQIATCCDDGTIRVWDLAGGLLLAPTTSAIYSQDGSTVLDVNGEVVSIKTALSRNPIAEWTNTSAATKFELSPNGRFVAAATDADNGSQIISVIDASNGKTVGSPVTALHGSRALVLGDSGEFLIIVGERELQLCNLHKGAQQCGPIQHEEPIQSVFISADGRKGGLWSKHFVRVWDCATGRDLFKPLRFDDDVKYAGFSPDASLLVTCVAEEGFLRRAAQIWNTANGTELPLHLIHNDGVLCAAFSPDGRFIATGGEDFTVHVWDLKTGKKIGRPLKHGERIKTVAFSRDGKWILTASADQTARVWSAETGDPLTPPLRHFFPLLAARFVGGEHAILTLDNKGTRRLWHLPIEQRSAADLELFSQFISGEIASAPDVLTLDSTSISNRWVRLQKSRPEDFTVSQEHVLEWHNFQARQSALEDNWKAALFHLQRLSSLRPGDRSVTERIQFAENRLKEKQ